MANTRALLLRGAGANLIASAATTLASLLVSLAVARHLGREGLGLLAVFLTAVMIGSLIADLGLDSVILRTFAGERWSAFPSLRSILRIKLAGSGLLAIVAVCFGIAAGAAHANLLVPAAVILLPRGVSSALEAFSKAQSLRRILVLTSVTTGLFLVSGVLAGLAIGWNIPQILLFMLAVESAKALGLFVLLVPKAPKSDTGGWRLLLRESLPFGFIGVAGATLARADILLICVLRDASEAGIFSAADRILAAGNLVAFALYGASIPIFSTVADRNIRHEAVRQSTVLTLAVALVGAILLSATAPLLTRETFGFEESVAVLRILSWTLPPILANAIVGSALFSLHQERMVLAVLSIACLLNIGVNVLLIPRFGATGAAVVSLGTEWGITLAYAAVYATARRQHRVSSATPADRLQAGEVMAGQTQPDMQAES